MHQLPLEVTARSRATADRQPRQARKGAAATVLVVCRGGAWLSLVAATFIFPCPALCKATIGSDVVHIQFVR